MTTLIINPAGVQGPAGIVWREAAWAIGVVYAARTGQYHQGSTYRARVAHTATVETEPGVGEGWETVWTYVAQSGELSPEGQIVSGIAAQIVTVAGVAAQVTAVAANAVAVSTVAADIGAVQTAAANIAAILAAPAAAEAAAESAGEADQAADDAEASAQSETAPDPEDPSSKSARTWAGEAESHAATAVAASLASARHEYTDDGSDIGAGVYELAVATLAEGVISRVLLAARAGDPGGTVTARLLVDGEPESDEIEVEVGEAIDTPLALTVPAGNEVAIAVLAVDGVSSLWMQVN
jgi:hypothetical protein